MPEAAIQHGAKNVSAEVLKHRFVAAWARPRSIHHTRAEWMALVDENVSWANEATPKPDLFP